jgi:dCMP deaminase
MSRPTKDEYWLGIAKVVSIRSTCLSRKFGAVIVTKNNVQAGSGYNGSARGVLNCCEIGYCRKRQLGEVAYQYDECVAVHAEENAVINSDYDKRFGSALYVIGTNIDGSETKSEPCRRCKRIILNSGIARVITKREGEIVELNPIIWATEDNEWIKSVKPGE